MCLNSSDHTIKEEKPIIRNNELIGYWQYCQNKGMFGLTFHGYRWIK